MDPLKKLHCNVFSTFSQEDGEKDWLENRKKGIGGSDIGPICGVSPFTSARQIYLVKTNQYPDSYAPDNAAKERMYFGHVLEPVVADEYAKRTGANLRIVKATLQHPEYPWAFASLDRLIVDDEENPVGILECKTTSEYMKDEWDAGEILMTYIYQINWYLWVTGLERGAFACLCGGNKFYMYDVFRNDELLNDVIIPAAKKFWEENVLALKEPEMQSVDTEFVNGIYAEVVKGSELTMEDDVANDLLDTIYTCKQQIKEVEATMEEAQNRIKDRLKAHEIGYTKDYVVKWSPRSQNRINSDLVKSLYPEIVPNVTKKIEFRAMSVKAV